MAVIIGDEDVVIERINADAVWTLELPLSERVSRSDPSLEVSIGVKYLDAVVHVIRDDDVVVPINRAEEGKAEVLEQVALRSELFSKFAVAGEYVNTIVTRVRDDRLPSTCDCDAMGLGKNILAKIPHRQQITSHVICLYRLKHMTLEMYI